MPTGEKKRIVVDTNVLISAALLRRSTSARALAEALEEFQVIQSEETSGELIDATARSKFTYYLDEERRARFLFVLAQAFELIGVRIRVTECGDPRDNKFLELAIDGNAWLIVGGDSHLLDLHPFRGIAIVSPGELLARGSR